MCAVSVNCLFVAGVGVGNGSNEAKIMLNWTAQLFLGVGSFRGAGWPGWLGWEGWWSVAGSQGGVWAGCGSV